jgi:4-oxalocrotonate tautomerase
LEVFEVECSETKHPQEVDMPYVSIRLAGTLNREQKEEMCAGVTRVIAQVTGKPEDSILIFVDEEQHDNIAKGGKLLKKPE